VQSAPEVVIRAATADDIAAIAGLRANALPDAIITPAGMALWYVNLRPEASLLLLVGEAAGEVVAQCTALRDGNESSDAGMLDVVVAAGRQRHGIGAHLASTGLAHLTSIGIRSVDAASIDGPAQRALATRFGFVEARASNVFAVDPRTVDPYGVDATIPPGVSIRSFAEIDDPRDLYELARELAVDVPGGDTELRFDQWTARYWRTLFADDHASLAAYVNGELAALTIIRVDRPTGRASNDLTGTRRAYRGRGLARLLKTHSLRRAAAVGAAIAFTTNHESNAAIMAVNERLGYRQSSRRIEWTRELPLPA
jgi:GNAT superfamily N-acetyltransferase